MLERILVPLDGSAAAEAILPDVRRLVHQKDAEVILVRAVQTIPIEAHAVLMESSLEEAEIYLKGIAFLLREEEIRSRALVLIGSPASVILDAAHDENVSLIAMATHGRSGVRRVLMGSVAEQILRLSSVPMFVVRTLDPPSSARRDALPVRRILAPQDLSSRASLILPLVADLSRLFGARVTLLHVLDRTQSRKDVEDYLRLASAQFSAETSLDVETCIETGDPAQVILDFAIAQGSDLIAMASHGLKGVDRLLTGSVTETVLRETLIPMVIVRTAGVDLKKPASAFAAGRTIF